MSNVWDDFASSSFKRTAQVCPTCAGLGTTFSVLYEGTLYERQAIWPCEECSGTGFIFSLVRADEGQDQFEYERR